MGDVLRYLNSEEARLDLEHDAGQRQYSYTRTRMTVLKLRLPTLANHSISGAHMHGGRLFNSEFEAILNYGRQHLVLQDLPMTGDELPRTHLVYSAISAALSLADSDRPSLPIISSPSLPNFPGSQSS